MSELTRSSSRHLQGVCPVLAARWRRQPPVSHGLTVVVDGVIGHACGMSGGRQTCVCPQRHARIFFETFNEVLACFESYDHFMGGVLRACMLMRSIVEGADLYAGVCELGPITCCSNLATSQTSW